MASLPMNDDKVQKLVAHTDTLLILLIKTYSQYLFLRPMMFNTELIVRYADPRKRTGFEHFRNTLYWTLVLEVVKLCDDSDSRSPSIAGLRRELSSPEVEDILEERYSRSAWPQLPGQTKENYARAQAEDSAHSRQRFRETFSKFMADSLTLLTSVEFLALKEARDKQVAHNELRFIDGKYQFASIEDLKYGHERKILETARVIVASTCKSVALVSFGLTGSKSSSSQRRRVTFASVAVELAPSWMRFAYRASNCGSIGFKLT